MYSSKHFEATGGHIGTPDSAFFAAHTWRLIRCTTKLNQGGSKIATVYRGVGKAVKQSSDANLLLILVKRRKIQANTVRNCQLKGFDKTCILLPKVYKKLYTGIIDWFLGSFTNFMIRLVSFSITERSKKLQNPFSVLVIYQRMQKKSSYASYSVFCLILKAEDL